MKRIFIYFLFLPLLFLACGEAEQPPVTKDKPQQQETSVIPAPNHQGPSFEFRILQMNDVYEIAPSRSTDLGGLARVAGLKNQLLAEDSNLITVLSGDFLSPSFIGLQLDEKGEPIAGRHMVEVLNAVGIDYVTFGNHEFDLSYEQLKRCMDMSNFKWTSCNVFHNIPMGVTYFSKDVNGKEEEVGRYIVHNFQDPEFGNIRLGMLAATLPFNLKDYVNYSTVFLAMKSTYEELYQYSDLILAMTHLEIESDKELARRLPIFPLMMGGHDHQNMLERVGNTVIAKADANANSVYVHTINYYPQSRTTKVDSKLIPINADIPEDPEVRKVVDKWMNFAEQSSMASNYDPYEVIFKADTAIDCREVTVRNRAANIGWLLGQSYLWAFEEADCAVLNSGSIRLDDYLEGEVEQQDILAMLPFGGPVSLVEMSGKDLQKTLDLGMYANIGKGGFLQVSNITKAGKFWYVGDEQLDYEKSYTVAMPKFLASGKETKLEFLADLKKRTLKSADNEKSRNDVRDIMIAYLKSLSQ